MGLRPQTKDLTKEQQWILLFPFYTPQRDDFIWCRNNSRVSLTYPTTNAKGLRMLKASGVLSVYTVIVYKFRATTLLSDLKGTGEGVAVLLSSRLTPLWLSADQIWNLRSWNFFGLNSASKTLIFSVGFVTGRLIMTAFPLLILWVLWTGSW